MTTGQPKASPTDTPESFQEQIKKLAYIDEAQDNDSSDESPSKELSQQSSCKASVNETDNNDTNAPPPLDTRQSTTNSLHSCFSMILSPDNRNPLLLCCAECIRCQVSCWWSCWWPCCEWSDCCSSTCREAGLPDEEENRFPHQAEQ